MPDPGRTAPPSPAPGAGDRQPAPGAGDRQPAPGADAAGGPPPALASSGPGASSPPPAPAPAVAPLPAPAADDPSPEIALVAAGRHSDPHRILGRHGTVVRCVRPGAVTVRVVEDPGPDGSGASHDLTLVHPG